jgi:hypothetical protein
MNIEQFGQLALHAVSPVSDPLALLLLEHEPCDPILTLLPAISLATDKNYSYPVCMGELLKHLLAGRGDEYALEKKSTFPIYRKCLRKVRQAFRTP